MTRDAADFRLDREVEEALVHAHRTGAVDTYGIPLTLWVEEGKFAARLTFAGELLAQAIIDRDEARAAMSPLGTRPLPAPRSDCPLCRGTGACNRVHGSAPCHCVVGKAGA